MIVGQSLRRKEDPRLLTGTGRYAADVVLPGMLYATVVRSRWAHAEIVRIDAAGAWRSGALAVLTPPDLGAAGLRIPFRLGGHPGLESFMQPVLAQGVVRYVGEPLAVVVGGSRYAAEDAAEGVRVEVGVRDPATDARQALEVLSPKVHAAAPDGNRMATLRMSKGDYASAAARADLLVSSTCSVQRHMASPMETRGLVADFDPGRGTLRVWGETKVPHFNRGVLAALLGLPEERIHFVGTDVGGSFGARGEFYPEDFLIPYLAYRLRRPVKWIEDRHEHLVAANHARDQVHDIQVALASDGRILGLRDRVICDMGAYARTTGVVTAHATLAHLAGPYDVAALEFEADCVATHKTPLGTYRGPGHYEGSFVRERIIDICAARLGLDPAEMRRRNLVRPEQMPYDVGSVGDEITTIFQDSDFPSLFERALQAAGYGGWRRRQTETGDAARRIGVGVAMAVSRSGAGPWEYGRVRVGPSGAVTAYSGGSPSGQGAETVLAQICADAVGARFEQVSVVAGDTQEAPYGIGSFGSRTTVAGGMAVHRAATALRARLQALASVHFETAVEDIELHDGRAAVRGIPAKSISFREVAALAAPGGRLFDPARPVLEEQSVWYTGRVTPCPAAVHVAVVELDVPTRSVRLVRYVIAYDVGQAINPRLVRGQVVGGLANGMGGVLLEELCYDPGGQMMNGSLADYLLPTASDMPRVEVLLSEDTPSRLNELGAKGADGGIAASGAAVANAIGDALRGLGAEVVRLPLGPSHIDRLLGDVCGIQADGGGTVLVLDRRPA